MSEQEDERAMDEGASGESASGESAIRARLEASMGPVQYSDLAAHLKREALFVVAPALSIVTCGVAIATDDASSVERWIMREELRRPTAEEREAWAADAERRWTALVVQPFVLVQDLARASERQPGARPT
ncbi:MAG: DUF2288 domain-containing protein [Myxococcota bacterium]|nr:DUF2288 domain-containing protein [Myxococcota bacterium]